MNARDLIARAEVLDAQARHHKREERRHRQAARAARQDLAELERQCARLGIMITRPSDQPGAGDNPWPRHPSSTSTP